MIGNQNLKRTVINNFDLRWENYFGVGEIMALSVFYKTFLNPIERTFNPEAVNPELTWRNVDNATLYGAEAEFRKKLGGWAIALDNFIVSANFTYVFSKVDMDQKELDVIKPLEPDYPDTREMSGQSPYIINATLTYKDDTAGFETNLSYNVAGKRLSIILQGGTPNIYEQPFHSLNFNISKRFGKRFKAKLSVSNILDAEHRFTYTRFNEKYTCKDQEYIYTLYNKGRVIAICLTYKLD
jgi:outer membrane receptor protein involved in Fe transport